MTRSETIYEQIGGAEGVRSIVEAFYPIVQKNPIIGPLFPEDIIPVKEKQFLFLSQFFGGPPLFSEAYGHPMMRARHLPIPIDEQNAQQWLACMGQALNLIEMDEELKEVIIHRLSGPAYHFINQ